VSLDTLNPWFNDWFQTRFRNKRGWRSLAYRGLSKGVVKALALRERLCDGVLITNESIVEDVTVLRWLARGPRVLDIGCSSVRLPIQLASIGFQVDGLDLRPYLVGHRNFRFHQRDLFDWKPPEKYDVVLCISAIESFGLGGYVPSAERPERDDAAATAHIREHLLKPDGQFFLSAPYGAWRVDPTARVYDPEHLARLTRGFRVANEAYFAQAPEGDWLPAPKDDPRWTSVRPVPAGVFVMELRL
jgi:hypothetical protein